MPYHINQSPLYKINSHAKLATVLGLSSHKVINKLLKQGSKSYITFQTEKGRDIQYPQNQLLRIHKRINSLLTRIQPPDYLFSGVKKRSNVLNAKTHVGNQKLVKIDIAKYYPSVTQRQIERCFIESFKCSKDVAKTLSELSVYNNHLPTGSVLSLSLSTAVNRPVFDHINTYCRSRNIKFTCYVDDMTFSGEKADKSLITWVTSYLKKSRGYKSHKIRNFNSETPKSVTGAVIVSDKLKVKNSHRNTIQSLLHNLNGKINTLARDSYELIRYFQVLQGHLFSAGQINPRYRQIGLQVVQKRKDLNIKALNQNTMGR